MARLESFRADYVGAVSALHGRDSRRIGHNTRLVRHADNAVALRYHATDVAEYQPDGWIVLRSGGWQTSTTADRLRQALPGPWSIASRRVGGQSAWWLWSGRRPVCPFADGIAVRADGSVGMSLPGGVETLLTPEAVAGIIAAEDAAEAEREARRAARIAAQHPHARPIRRYSEADGWHNGYGLGLAHGRARPYDCPSCTAEASEWQALRDAARIAEHERVAALPAGDPVAQETHGRHAEPSGYGPGPDYAPRYRLACPWDCPRRTRNA